MKSRGLKILYAILSILFLIVINASTIFMLISQLIDVNINTIDIHEWGRTIERKLELLLKYSDGKDVYLSFWDLMGGWRLFLIWSFMIAGWGTTIITIFKVSFNNLKNKRNIIQRTKEKQEEYDLLKLKIKADMNQLDEKDLKEMEKVIYGSK